jgi:NAD(P)-dependent dehydrogenase (short-subunit alcohol dehydrogenase family)
MFSPFDLKGRGAVVTGGNGGIGLGMARALLAAGARVAIWGSRAEKTEAAKAALARECGDPSRVHAFVCDVTDEAQVESTFARSVAALGGCARRQRRCMFCQRRRRQQGRADARDEPG